MNARPLRGASVAFLCLWQPWVHLLAQGSPPPSPLTLPGAIAYAQLHNPDLRIASALEDSARGQARMARALPNPVFQSIPGSPSQFALGLPLDIGPQRHWRVRAAELGTEAAVMDRAQAQRQLVLAVQRAFYDVLLADALRRYSGARRDAVRELARADSTRVRAGDLAERTLVRSEVEVARADADLARADNAAQVARLALDAALGSPVPDTARVLSGTLAFADVQLPDSAALAAAVALRPDVTAADTRVAQSHDLRRLASASLVPVPLVSVVRQVGQTFDSGRTYALGLGVEVPLLNLYRGDRERAAAGERAAQETRARAAAGATRDGLAAISQVRIQRALVERYESGLTRRVALGVEASRYAYQRGAISQLEVLDALRAQQDVLADHATALHDYWVSVRVLEAQLGRALVP